MTEPFDYYNARRQIWRIVLIYAAFSAAWILVSDRIAQALVPSLADLEIVNTLKGWIFVAVTATLIFALMNRAWRFTERASHGERMTATLLAAIAESSEDAIFAKDLQGRYTLFNRAAAKVVGRSAAEVIGQDDRAIFPEETAELIMAADRSIVAGRIHHTSEEQIVTRQGLRTFLATKGPLYDHGDVIFGTFGISRDVTELKREELAVQRERNLLKTLFRGLPDLAWLKDPQGIILACNARFEEFVGAPEVGLVGRHCHEFFRSEIAAQFEEGDSAAIAGGGSLVSESRVVFASDGHEEELETIKTPIFDDDGKLTGVLGTARDITARRATETQIRLAAQVFDAAGEGIMITDPDRRILRVNPAFSTVTGYAADEVVGKNPSLLKSGRHGRAFYAALWKAVAKQGWWHGEIWNRRKNGEIYPQWLTLSTVRDAEGKIANYVALFTDITEIKRSLQRIEFLASHDELTGLPNRTSFLGEVSAEIARASRHRGSFAILFIDLDNFKVVNDSLGHPAGDLLLKEVARRLGACHRSSDAVARFGGDEFAMLVVDATCDEAEAAARRIAAALAEPLILAGQQVYSSASVGISRYPDDGADAETLIKHADTAMYLAKESGKATHQLFTDALKSAADERLQLENGLRRAIDQGELFLLYQPQVELATGRLAGAEALVRWQHPELGLIPPSKFIPLAEKSGLIDRLGDWVAETACRQLAAWYGQSYFLSTLSINVSPEQLRRSDVPKSIRRLLEEYRVEPRHLTIELTESALMADPDRAQEQLESLKQCGVHLSIDDFGTGYSSLAYLRRYPIDELKIDRTFVNEVATNPDDRAIAQTIIAMAQALGLSVVAEGIETIEQFEVLHSLGCQTGQGYFFAEPLPPDELVRRFPANEFA